MKTILGNRQVSKGTKSHRFWSKVDVGADDECWPWQGARDKDGYGIAYGRSSRRAHRIAWELYNRRSIPGGLHVLHRCDNRACCAPHHLYTGTHQQNMRDRSRRGRCAAKLTLTDAIAIRQADSPGTFLAQAYWVSRSLISLIRNGLVWGRSC